MPEVTVPMSVTLPSSGLMVEWTESDQKKGIVNVPPELYELGCIQDVEAGLKVTVTGDATSLSSRSRTVAHWSPGVRRQRRSATR